MAADRGESAAHDLSLLNDLGVRLIAEGRRIDASLVLSARDSLASTRESLRVAHMHALQGGYDDPDDRDRVRRSLGATSVLGGSDA